jgi:hypothetical protein
MWYSIVDYHLYMKYQDISLVSSALALRSMQDPCLLQDQSPNASIPIFLQPLIPMFFISFLHRPTFYFLGFQTEFFPSGIFLNTLFTFFILASLTHFRTILIFLSNFVLWKYENDITHSFFPQISNWHTIAFRFFWILFFFWELYVCQTFTSLIRWNNHEDVTVCLLFKYF